MISKEYFQSAVVAEPEEVEELNNYLARRALNRSFQKVHDRRRYGLEGSQQERPRNWKLAPYLYLRTDLALLLGPSGSKLLNRIWTQYHLSPTEEDPARIRPALMKLFSVAARIAAPKGVGHALKRLVGDFEKIYFPVVLEPRTAEDGPSSRRFSLLSMIQNGQGEDVLNGIRENPEAQVSRRPQDDTTYPSRSIGEDPDIARRRFLFEAACRAKSWSEAYTHARLLKRHAASVERLGPRLVRVFEGAALDGCPKSKKKQLLTDLAGCFDLPPETRLTYALQAISHPTPECRPGEAEALVCDLLPSTDPWWRASLNRLYRHLPVPGRWTADLRTLCQSEPNSRGFYRVLLNLLNFSCDRALASLPRYMMDGPPGRPSPGTTQRRLERIREEGREWLPILPPAPSMATSNGASVELDKEVWSFLSEVCSTLSTSPPLRARTCFQSQPVQVEKIGGRRVLSLGPELFSCSEPEQRFLLARALFREAAGLDRLEERAVSLASPPALYQWALEHAARSCHRLGRLTDLEERLTDITVGVALEELYWETLDPTYQKLSLILQYGGWCPLFEREADLFAARFTDIVSASHAMVKETFWGKQLRGMCSREGLGLLIQVGKECPSLCLRLQTLWLWAAEEYQRDPAHRRDLPDEVLC